MLSKTSEVLSRFIRNVPRTRGAGRIARPAGSGRWVAIARAGALRGSKLILMDEPTAALGVAETKAVEEVILELKRRGLTIWSSATISIRSFASQMEYGSCAADA